MDNISNIKRSICKYCKEGFIKNRVWQKTCGGKACVLRHKVLIARKWRLNNPGYSKVYAASPRLARKMEKKGGIHGKE